MSARILARSKRTLARTALYGAMFALLAACSSLRSPPPTFPESPPPSAPSSGTAQPPPTAPPQPTPGAPSRPPPKQYHLGAASSALVAQAHKQMSGGDFGLAAATIERAMRIEPDNPLLWIELGRVRYTAGDYGQADSMGRKALALAAGDPQAQASAWRLIADSLRSRGRNEEAADADKRANALSPQ
jgi:tetratricopeptide (TPR) repeat protein